MREVIPRVYLVARPELDLDELIEYLRGIGARSWVAKLENEEAAGSVQDLIESAGRICYRSWEPGLNANVTRIHEDQDEYLENILASGHGSVLEHASFSFIFRNVSRVFTHELARHRAGCAISQESMRYVRVDDIPFWFPGWAKEEAELMLRAKAFLDHAEEFQRWMTENFGLDEEGIPFTAKKRLTSFKRRFIPDGVATGLMWTANVRTLRHVIALRTDSAAEEEIRLVFGKVAEVMQEEAPALFRDFTRRDDGSWAPRYRKV